MLNDEIKKIFQYKKISEVKKKTIKRIRTIFDIKTKMKSNVKEWNWKINSIKKKTQNKINSNQMLRNEIEK